jgi:hypothetical protein
VWSIFKFKSCRHYDALEEHHVLSVNLRCVRRSVITSKTGQRNALRAFNDAERATYSGNAQKKFVASSVLPVPLYFAT